MAKRRCASAKSRFQKLLIGAETAPSMKRMKIVCPNVKIGGGKMLEKNFRLALKQIFRGYKKMTPAAERGLAQLGISVKRCQKHIVLHVVSADGTAHSIPISRTGGDKREGLNVVSHIMKTIYR